MSAVEDFQLAALATGFTLGFGLLTVWEAIKQTKRNRNRLRSQYIYMVWGEIFANLVIVIIGWLFLHGKIGPTIQVLFFILFFWVFQIQLLMQIIVNRIALIAEHRETIRQIKWGTAAVITTVNISVFCIWIPAHLPSGPPIFAKINLYWDKIEKVIVLIVDAGLNYYFLRTVKQRLVKQHGLQKYAPLVGFNAKLMVVSVGMDAMLIGLMFLKNQIVYIQVHPVVYMVKLNIEMTMASLVIRLAQGRSANDKNTEPFGSNSNPGSSNCDENVASCYANHGRHRASVQLSARSKRAGNMVQNNGLSKINSDDSRQVGGIECRTDVDIVVEKIQHKDDESTRSSNEQCSFGDQILLRKIGPKIVERPV